MSIEQLSQIQVTSVSKRPQLRRDAAAAVYVITRDQILRSGARSIPEALRLAPGVEVARTNAHTWAVSIRGFNSDTANKLLVLVDGRSVYSPLYAGVFWDVQDTLLEDIDRIEVIEGPGGTLWGANAVNGVINIITRDSAATQGGVVDAGGGDGDRAFGGARYGWRIGEHATARAYVKALDRSAYELGSGASANDDWRMAQGGFHADWKRAADALTLQGDTYSGKTADRIVGVGGANLEMRWQRQLHDGATLQLQSYWDHTDRRLRDTFSELRDTYDVELQEHRPGVRHDLVFGAGYRLSADTVDNTPFASFLPPHRSDQLFSAFAQDEIRFLDDRLALTVGSKIEHNDYTGFELEPNVRLAYLPDASQTLWTAISRAVRTPSRLDSDLLLTAPFTVPGLPVPVTVVIRGSSAFDSEKLVAYEAGYRVRPSDTLELDVAGFYDSYTELRSTETEAAFVDARGLVLPNHLGNGLAGSGRGGTVSLRWSATRALTLQPSYTHLDLDFHAEPWSTDKSSAKAIVGSSPRNQWKLLADLDLPSNAYLTASWRHVGELPALGVPAYSALDASIFWRPSSRLELGLYGTNLLDPSHREFAPAGSIELPRTVEASARWRF